MLCFDAVESRVHMFRCCKTRQPKVWMSSEAATSCDSKSSELFSTINKAYQPSLRNEPYFASIIVCFLQHTSPISRVRVREWSSIRRTVTPSKHNLENDRCVTLRTIYLIRSKVPKSLVVQTLLLYKPVAFQTCIPLRVIGDLVYRIPTTLLRP